MNNQRLIQNNKTKTQQKPLELHGVLDFSFLPSFLPAFNTAVKRSSAQIRNYLGLSHLLTLPNSGQSALQKTKLKQKAAQGIILYILNKPTLYILL